MKTYMFVSGKYSTATKDAPKQLNAIFMAAKELNHKRILPDGTPLSKEGRDALPMGATYYVIANNGDTVFENIVGEDA